MKKPLIKFMDILRSNSDEQGGIVNPNFTGDDGSGKTSVKKYNSLDDKSKEEEEGPSRDQWASPVEFLLSCIAMSVGLGNVWRFPFTAYENGGGAFLIPYIVVLVLIGKPLYYMELCMGQFSSYGSVKVWAVVPAFKGVGYGQALATWCVVTYYVSLMALTVFYFFASFHPTLPWASCPAKYAETCFDSSSNASIIDFNVTKPASEIYYEEEVLHIHHRGLDDGIFPPEWRLTLCLLLAWIILFLTLVKGVKSSGKSAYFTALFPYVVLFILLIRGATLPGATDGVLFFITPVWSKLLEPEVWFKAVGQSFFSLSVGFGSIIMFSSYNNFRHNVYRDAAIISVTDTLTSLLAGFTIFAILGHLAHDMGQPIEKVLSGGGSGLAFISYPDVLARLPIPQFFAVLFFLMLFTLGVGSASALAGCIITIICDQFPSIPRWAVTSIVCVAGFLLGLFYVTPQGQYILDLIDHYGGNFIIYILAFLEVAAVQWIYGLKNFIRDIEFMLNRKTGIYWRLCWAVLIPFLLLFIFIYSLAVMKPLQSAGYTYGPGANAVGIVLVVIAIGFIPVLFTVCYIRNTRSYSTVLTALAACFRATDDWSPKDPQIRVEYEEYVAKKCIKPTFPEGLAKIPFWLKYIFWDD